MPSQHGFQKRRIPNKRFFNLNCHTRPARLIASQVYERRISGNILYYMTIEMET